MESMKQEQFPQRGVYANLTNDYMFKRVFGSEESKDILITFLNHVIGNGEIADVSFQNNEHLGPTEEDRKAVFDISVHTQSGEEYIIEMQLAQQAYFRDRALFYTSYPVINQAAIAKEKFASEHGASAYYRWNFNLKPVRFVAIVNFMMDHDEGWDTCRYHSSYRLREDCTGELLHDKLQFVFLELARFCKSEYELEDNYDKWMFLLKNMSQLQSRPKIFNENEFDRLFEIAELCNFTAEQYKHYQDSQKMLYDYENTIDYARQQGHEAGLAEGREVGIAEGREAGLAEGEAMGRLKIAREMKADGVDSMVISRYTGLSYHEIESL
ncbi:MAG: Rpn family recombination-promoting nuclease/putative transposase [Clostridium sp.]|nr:Rpn family recombination-promoting nuclease/putative transposase [Bacteroides sp.]MCM1198994.1 Rpn family recombination-promoting nuclease/putative transposase [Clostridium sp.]